jgi:carboxylesterase type B
MELESWGEGVLDGSNFRSICYQPGEQRIWDVVYKSGRGMIRKRKLEQYPMSEDCLTLNIYVPLVREKSRLVIISDEEISNECNLIEGEWEC